MSLLQYWKVQKTYCKTLVNFYLPKDYKTFNDFEKIKRQ